MYSENTKKQLYDMLISYHTMEQMVAWITFMALYDVGGDNFKATASCFWP